MSNEEKGQSWYREPWAWLVVGLPLSAVAACMVTIVIAIRTADGLVVDDYYKRGLEINRVLDREARAAELGLALEVTALNRGDYAFTLAAQTTAAFPDDLDVLFAHATRAAGDQATRAEHLGGGHYRGRIDPLDPGPWYLDVSTPEWRLVRRVVVGSEGRASLR